MIAKVNSSALIGVDAIPIEVEVDISFGLPVFHIVGLPEAAVRESRERVRSAIKNSGYTFPTDRVIINLAPADVKKEGTGLDLPVAVGILAASGLIPEDRPKNFIMAGELSLDGRIKPIKGGLPLALAARDHGFTGVIMPKENADEAALVPNVQILPVDRLYQVVDYFNGHFDIPSHKLDSKFFKQTDCSSQMGNFSDVKGQSYAKRALEISVAGSHHILMNGPPGSGKSMLARRLCTILPKPSFDEMMETARIYSVMGMASITEMTTRPFRSPHHTISDAGLVGGGSRPVPGEISLAHNGVLFLDELPEFKRNVLEALRQPIEEGRVTISRAGIKSQFPCRFMLVAAMNPCPCGYFTDPSGKCTCTPLQLQKYRSKISGPLIDRIDIHIEVPRVNFQTLSSSVTGETSLAIRTRVEKAREIQSARFQKTKTTNNSQMQNKEQEKFCRIDSKSRKLIEKASDQLGLSARGCRSVLKVARTIADLDKVENIHMDHLAEAIQYRSLDRPAI